MINQLKRSWNESPMTFIGVGAVVIASTAKLIDALSAAKGRRAYAKQVNYRVKKNR